ncbi:hypothetical protein [Methanoculleus chikugoensis]|uniref:hypothetical protein n=1 Tax=Methanoculleus chikugoensis TaxID=118126 RepID=UPI001FB28365|nr:hypothetical protein [Methanoculleus chikugoensis]
MRPETHEDRRHSGERRRSGGLELDHRELYGIFDDLGRGTGPEVRGAGPGGFQVRLELESVGGDVRKENETFLVRTASGTVYRSRTLILAPPGKEPPRRLGDPG